jgi:hypothetical protein
MSSCTPGWIPLLYTIQVPRGTGSIAPTHCWPRHWMGWVVKRRPRFNPPGKELHWIGVWVWLRSGLDTEARGKSFASAGDRIPVVQSVLRHYTDWATPARVGGREFLCLSLSKYYLISSDKILPTNLCSSYSGGSPNYSLIWQGSLCFTQLFQTDTLISELHETQFNILLSLPSVLRSWDN